VESAVVVTHLPSGIVGQAGERRSQHANRKVALQRLRISLAVEIRRSKPSSEPSDLWNSRCRAGKINANPAHGDFPCLLAEALDQIADAEFQIRPAAETLGVSSSQLIKFCKLAEPAFDWINLQRIARNLGPLR
jgi:hypothetical protein